MGLGKTSDACSHNVQMPRSKSQKFLNEDQLLLGTYHTKST